MNRDRIHLGEFGLSLGRFLLDCLAFAFMTAGLLAFVVLLWALTVPSGS